MRQSDGITSQGACRAVSADALEWISQDKFTCRSLLNGSISVYAKENDLDHVYVIANGSPKARTEATQHGPLYLFHVDNSTTQELQLWEVYINLKEGLQKTVSKELMWSRSVGQIERLAVPQVSCKGSESLISRNDGSILRSLCLDGFVSVVSQTPDGNRNIMLLSITEGALLHAQRLPGGVDKVDHLLIDNNKVILMYENSFSRRTELALTEFFTEHHSINRLIALADRMGVSISNSPSGEAEDIQDGDIKVFQGAFTLDVASHKISSVAITQTAQRVTPQSLILAVPEAEKLYLIPPKMLTARRPIPPALTEYISDGVIPGGAQDVDAVPYDAYIPLVPWRFIPDELVGVQNLTITCEPGTLESMTVVTFPSSNIPGLPYYPALKYNSLSDDYSRVATTSTLIALFAFVFYSFHRLFSSKSSSLWK